MGIKNKIWLKDLHLLKALKLKCKEERTQEGDNSLEYFKGGKGCLEGESMQVCQDTYIL